MNSTFPFTLPEIRDRFSDGICPDSVAILEQAAAWLQRTPGGKRLAVLAKPDSPALALFDGESQEDQAGCTLVLCPLSQANGCALRELLPALKPVPLGLETSLGAGDRLGLATPGHVRALRKALAAASGKKILPIFAQQSMRENARTRRTPEEVLSDATWGAFQAGWQGPVGADADHLKTTADIDLTAAAGYSFFTIDPGEYVDGRADGEDPAEIERKLAALPWELLESSPRDLESRYAGRVFDLGEGELSISQAEIARAAAKYGQAIAHVVRMYRHLEAKGLPFELEVSVDETETPTRPAEHFYIASELKRLGVHWVSLAPRFVGRFEKGVDYLGDLDELALDLEMHARIARCLGPYKLSLHSGSDKFSVYPLIARAARGLVHLKTAGTSYLEALRVLAAVEPALFREILGFAITRYPADRASYHVSARLERVPLPGGLADADLPGLLEDFDARQVLHVTFGSALDRFGEALLGALRVHEEFYSQTLEKHFWRHLAPFVGTAARD
jgi:hypothetical protein